MVVRVSANRAPALAGDAQDHDGHPKDDDVAGVRGIRTFTHVRD
jgi:hypothetical protein